MVRRGGKTAFLVCVALTVGAIAAAAASFAGWRLAAPSPTVEETTAAVRMGFPDAPIVSIGWHDDVRDVHSIEQPGAENLPGQQEVLIHGGATSRDSFDKARERFDEAGWRTEIGSSTVPGGGSFVANRGDLVLEWEFSPSGTYSEPGDSIEVWVWRFTPPRVKVFTVVGWLLGAALGWWIARGILRLAHRRAGMRSRLVAWVLVVVLGLSTLGTSYLTVHNLVDRPGQNGQPVALWTAYFPFLLPFGFRFG